jgi:hypothetical protein
LERFGWVIRRAEVETLAARAAGVEVYGVIESTYRQLGATIIDGGRPVAEYRRGVGG